MPRQRRKTILIVGGGIAGLTLAAALHRKARQGVHATLVERERARTSSASGAGIAIQPNGIRVLRALGLGADVERAGAVVRRWQFLDERGTPLCTADLEKIWNGIGPFVGIERQSLHAVLTRAVGSVRCHLGTTVQSVVAEDDQVLVHLRDGSMREVDLLVGADGVDSATRGLLGPDASASQYSGQMVWRSIARTARGPGEHIRFFLGNGCFFGLCPVGDGQTYGFANVTGPRFRDGVEGRLSRLRRRFSSFGEAVQEYLTALESDEQIQCAAITWHASPRWSAGRILLIGDAAHASLPLMGQGGCMAMEDAFVLAALLGDTYDIDAALREFVRRRQSRVDWVRTQSLAATDSLSMDPVLRNAALRERGPDVIRARYAPLVEPP